jgi:hypothetical protein
MGDRPGQRKTYRVIAGFCYIIGPGVFPQCKNLQARQLRLGFMDMLPLMAGYLRDRAHHDGGADTKLDRQAADTEQPPTAPEPAARRR